MADKILTRKDDAATIVGDELAEEMEKEAELVGKSEALVIRSEEEVAQVEEATTKDDKKEEVEELSKTEEEEEVEDVGKKKKKSEVDESVVSNQISMEEIKALINDTISNTMKSFIKEPAPVDPTPSHPLDTFFSEFKSKFDLIINSEVSEDEKLRSVQEPFSALGTGIVSVVKSSIKPREVNPEVQGQMDLVNALSQVMNPIAQKLDLVLTQLSTPQVERTMPTIPQRRSIPPEVAQKLTQQPVVSKSETPHLRALIDKTV
jgi:hypothetical protein